MNENGLTTRAASASTPIFNLLGAACCFVALAWIFQALAFTGNDVRAAEVAWIIMGAIMAGLGAGFLLAGRFLFGPTVAA